MNVNKKYIQKLQSVFSVWEKSRREVQDLSANALQKSKQAIFSFHRNDWKAGEELLKQALMGISQAQKMQAKSIAADDEGILKAAMEEYSEADLYRQFLYQETIGPVKGLEVSPETYMGGLSDAIGEIQRYALKQATERNWAELKRAATVTEDLMAALVQFNFTGYLRTKFDQAKGARRKIEEISYEVSLRK